LFGERIVKFFELKKKERKEKKRKEKKEGND